MRNKSARVVLGLVALAYCVVSPGGGWLGGSWNVLAAGEPQAKNPVSKAEEIQGELEVIVEDGKANWRTLYYLKTAVGKLSLHFAKQPSQDLRTGMKVSVRGVQSGNDITADSLVTQDIGGSSTPTALQTASATLSNTTGEHKVLVILVNFQDLQTQPFTVAQAQDVTFNTVSNYYRENSYGQTWLTGDVYGWYTIPVSSTSCDTSAIATYAQQAATKAGANLSAYNHYVYAFPQNACTFSGNATVGGAPSEAWINGYYELNVVAHELGHGFGLFHSRSMDCGPVVIGGTCTINEYGDSFDIMGAGSSTHFNPFQKERLGWLNSGSFPPIQTVTSSGTYFLDAYETISSNSKALKILKSTDPSTGLRTWYYLQHLTPTGFDSYLGSWGSQANGIVLRTGSETSGQDTYLLDTTPNTADWSDAMLIPSQSFSDSALGLTITTVSADSTGAWVQISMNSQPCTRANPSVSVSPAQSGWLLSGVSYSYMLTVTNNDSSGCSAADFSAGGSVPSGWSASSASLNLVPGATSSTAIVVTSPAGTVDGNYGIALSVSNVSDTTRSAVASATYTIASKLSVVDTPGSTKYTRTQKATVTATVTVLGSLVANATVSFSMTKPNGSIVTSSAVTGANGVATFVYAFNKRTDPIGTYRVSSVSTVNSLSGTGSTSFSVTK